MLVQNQRIIPRSESGAVLIITMILMIVFSLLTISMFDLLRTSTQISGNHKMDLRSIYIADAGVEMAINALRIYPDNPTLPDPDTPFAGGTFTVSLANINPNPLSPTFYREMDVISTGTIQGYSRTINVHAMIIAIGTSSGYGVATTSWRLQ